MWVAIIPLLAALLLPLSYLAESRLPDIISTPSVVTNPDVSQFTVYAFAVGKKLSEKPRTDESWSISQLPLPETWKCSTGSEAEGIDQVCPWNNRFDATTGFRYAFGTPKNTTNLVSDIVIATNSSPSFGAKINGRFIGGLAQSGVTPPTWIPDGSLVFLARQWANVR